MRHDKALCLEHVIHQLTTRPVRELRVAIKKAKHLICFGYEPEPHSRRPLATCCPTLATPHRLFPTHRKINLGHCDAEAFGDARVARRWVSRGRFGVLERPSNLPACVRVTLGRVTRASKFHGQSFGFVLWQSRPDT